MGNANMVLLTLMPAGYLIPVGGHEVILERLREPADEGDINYGLVRQVVGWRGSSQFRLAS